MPAEHQQFAVPGAVLDVVELEEAESRCSLDDGLVSADAKGHDEPR